MKSKQLHKTNLVWFAAAMLMSLNAIGQTMNTTVEIYEGERKTISATHQGTGYSGEAYWQTYSGSCTDGTGAVVVLNEETWSIQILALRPGSASFSHYEIYYDGGRKSAIHNITVVVKPSNNDKLKLTPSIERTRVLKGTVLQLTSSMPSTIYYSTSGNVIPGKSSTFPSSGITLNSTMTVRAQAVKSQYPLSDVFEQTYDVIEADFQTTVAGGNTIYFRIISEEDKTCEVLSVPETATGTLRIPRLIDGYNVIAISEQALAGCKDITSVIIPSTIVSIGERALDGCTGLTSIELPEGLTQLGERAFAHCTGLIDISIPASVTDFGKSAFEDCTSLVDINFAEGQTQISERAFAGCIGLKALNLPTSLMRIGNEAFAGCIGLASVTLHSSIENFGTAIFRGCSGLESVDMAEGLLDIGENTFEDCTSLMSVNLPSSLQKIGNSMFCGCTAIEYVSVPACVAEIGVSAFGGCTSLEKIALSKGLTSINNSAFQGCSGLTEVDIPASVTAIGSKAFYDCPAMKTIHSYIKDPFIISDDVFTCYDETVTLYVPKGTSDMYWSCSGWIQFENIVEMEKGTAMMPPLGETEAALYSLAGQRLDKTQKGINIKNGKKILVR